MKANLFYSWQSNLPAANNRNFLENCIKKAVKRININNSCVLAILDRDTKYLNGSPDIVSAIFRKIDKAKLFLCDVSFVNDKQTPNSNVLIELGYAIKSLGWDRIICFFNTENGDVKNLPFNINHNRIVSYNLNNASKNDEEKRLVSIIEDNTNNLFYQGKLFNPVEDYIKSKIDYHFLEIGKNLTMVLYPDRKEYNYSTIFSEIHDLSKEDLAEKLSQNWVLGFYVFQKYKSRKDVVLEIFDKLLSTTYFQDSWKEIVVLLNEWLERWNDITNPRFHNDKEVVTNRRKHSEKYVIKDMYSENKSNGQYSVLLLKVIDNESAKVIKGGELLNDDYSLSIHEVKLSKTMSKFIGDSIYDFFRLFERWMEETGYEIVLDYEYFKIK